MKRLITLLYIFTIFIAIHSQQHQYSATIPVLHIHTANQAPILSKQTYIDATCYIDAMGNSSFTNMGSSKNQISLRIRGRGNYTWTRFDKKPYRLKFDKKQAPLGMAKDKNFVLLAHADDQFGTLRNAVAFKISSMLNMPYTPDFRPVEVMLNDEYIGLYMLTENIRADKNRVNISKQDNGAEDNVDRGWLVEIDNYEDENQIQIPVTDTNLPQFYITYHAPDSLSTVQKEYLHRQFTLIKQAVFNPDKTSAHWQQLIDIDQLTRFYLTNQIVGNYEAFLGSCYMYKDKAESKWCFGPIWDVGQGFNDAYENTLIEVNNPFEEHAIIEEIAKYPDFQNKVRDMWQQFYPHLQDSIYTYIDHMASYMAQAQSHNKARWPQYVLEEEEVSAKKVKKYLKNRIAYLNQLWSPTNTIANLSPRQNSSPYIYKVFTIDGIFMGSNIDLNTLPMGIYLIKQANRRCIKYVRQPSR